MALTDSRQFWEWVDCCSPREGVSRGSMLGCVQPPILASLTRLLAWAQPSAPCLALNDLPGGGLTWDWHIFPGTLRASSSPP